MATSSGGMAGAASWKAHGRRASGVSRAAYGSHTSWATLGVWSRFERRE